MEKVEKVGEYFYSKTNTSNNKFLLLFSGGRTPAGKFNYMRSFVNSDYNIIFLNCTEDSYYHKGIKGLGDLSDTINFIRNFIGKYTQTPEITTFGCSMGGYGSVLYGTLLNAKNILAIGPSTPRYTEYLNSKASRERHCEIFDEQIPLLKNGQANKVILSGDRTLNDILSYHFFSSLPNTVIEIYYEMPHEFVVLLAQVMPLHNLIELMIRKDFDKIPFENTSHYKKSAWLAELSDGNQLDGIKSFDDIALDVNSIELSLLTYTELYILGVAKLKSRQAEKALECFRMSLQKSFSVRALKRILDLKPLKNEITEILLLINASICKGDLLKLARSEFDESYSLYCILNERMDHFTSYDTSKKIPGYVDGFFGSSIKGWCHTEGVDKQGVILKINDLLPIEHNSDLYRKDLENHGLGDGKHGFVFDINLKSILKLMSNLTYVSANIIDKYTKKTLPRGNLLIKAPYPLLYIDSYELECFSGWVVDYAYPTRKIILDIFINKVFVRSVIPAIVRDDLESKGFNKTSGFNISLVGLLKTGPNTLVFKDSETGLNVSNVINIKG
jgi:hypothetical protein